MHEGRILSNTTIDIEGDPSNEAQAGMGQASTLPQTSDLFFTLNSATRSHSGENSECSVSVIQKKTNDILQGFSRVNWNEGKFCMP